MLSEINSYEEVTPQLVERIRRNFEEEKIKIQILGCYMDLGNPDDEVRKNAVDTFKKCLKFNQILGASIVGTETAYPRLSREEKQIWHPYMMDSIARLVEEAERLDVDMADVYKRQNCAFIAVSITPHAMALTCTLLGASSFARAFVSPFIPDLVAE